MTMNIKEAKEQIKNAMTAYFTKDEFGSYAVPVEKQRPVFLMEPSGHRQDRHHGADRPGVGRVPGVLLHDPPHPAERPGSALH